MKLKKLEVRSFAGIHPSSPVIIDFSESNFVTVSGDNGAGKTSLLNALLVACGQLSHMGKEGKNFINNKSGNIDIDFDFVGKDRYNYHVKCTKSTFKLTYEGEAIPEPLTKMKELLGVVAVSPMQIKDAKLKDIVKWLAAYNNKDADYFERKMLKYKDGIKQSQTTRADANRSLKGLDEFLATEPMFAKWSESEKKYAEEPKLEEISAKHDAAKEKSDKYIKYESNLRATKFTRGAITASIESIEADIKRLQEQIVEKEKALKEKNDDLVKHDADVQKGEKWLKDNFHVKTSYDEIAEEYKNAAQTLTDYNKWQEIVRKKCERDQFETISQDADAKEKDLLQKVKELQAEILPDIKGADIVMEDTHENGVQRKEGLYLDGKNVQQLSETEWYAFVMSIWKKYKVKVVVVDNMQSLGSKGVEWLEKLSNDGAFILAAEMNRQQKELQISYE